MPEPIPLPTREISIRIGGDWDPFLENLSRLGTIYVQTRTECGGLGKFIDSASLYLDSDEGRLCAPGHGLMLSLDRCIAIHATRNENSVFALDFEFEGRPGGVSFYITAPVSDAGVFHELVKRHSSHTLSNEELEKWREGILTEHIHCPKCERAAADRVRQAPLHPINEILRHLSESGISAHARLLSGHADLTTWFLPRDMGLEAGVLLATDSYGATLSLNLRYLHALAIANRRIDDAECSVLEIYNSYGARRIEILVEEPDLATAWEEICTRSYLRKYH